MIYFISDIHLDYYDRNVDRRREDLFLNWLKNIKSDCTKLVLLGDIFDY